MTRGEVLPPEILSFAARSVRFPVSAQDEHLNYVATLLDDMFSIPGTKIRFGLDALIGWIPGIGDALAAAASCLIIFVAWHRGVARITFARMLCNVTIENLIGAIPIVGDLAHVAWKSNRRNYNLLVREHEGIRKHTWQDWLFVAAMLLLILGLFLGPAILLLYILRSHRLFV